MPCPPGAYFGHGWVRSGSGWFEDKPRRLAARSERGHVAALDSKRQKKRAESGVAVVDKAGCEPKRFVKEFRTDGEDHGCEVGGELTVSVFADVPFIDVIGTSKGRGFAGVMKRHNFSGQRATHGVKRVHRHGGSIGMSADPSRVLKGLAWVVDMVVSRLLSGI